MYAEAGLIDVVEVDLRSVHRPAARRRRLPGGLEHRVCRECSGVMVLQRRPGRPPKRCPRCSGQPVKRLVRMTTFEEVLGDWTGADGDT